MKISRTIMFFTVFLISILTLAGCADKDGRDDFDAASYIVSAGSEIKDDELEITVIVKDEWEFVPVIEHNLIVNEIDAKIEAESNKHKSDDNIKSHTLITKTESGDDAGNAPKPVTTIINANGVDRCLDEFVIKIDGQLYYGTTEEVEVDSSKGIRGKITSYTKDGSLPVEDDQSNYDMAGASYTDGGEVVQVQMTEDWYNFYPEKRFCKVLHNDDKIEEFLYSGNGESNELWSDTIEKAALSFYNPTEYGMSENGDRFFMGVIDVFDYNEEDDKVQVFLGIHGEGYTILDDYVKNTHGFGEVRHIVFEKNEDGKFLNKTNEKYFENKQVERIENLEKVEKHMLTTYLNSIGKGDFEIVY